MLSQPAGSWGAEMGSNEHGVCIGCSQLQNSDTITSGLTAHDLVRYVKQKNSATTHLYSLNKSMFCHVTFGSMVNLKIEANFSCCKIMYVGFENVS